MKQKILDLKDKNTPYKEIAKQLGCPLSLVYYHCTDGQKEKYMERNKRNWKQLLVIKLVNFSEQQKDKKQLRKPTKKDIQLINAKITTFKENTMSNITTKDFLDKYKDQEVKCYITGEPIDITKPRTYQLDHIIPRSRGGESTLDNLGICTKQANSCKSNLTYEEFVELCKKVVENNALKSKPIS